MFESLKIFIAAAERGSINGAAETCFITPPAALKRINSLEAEVGVRLFERNGRGVKLTRAGESYYRDALKIVAEGEDATARARRAAGGSVVIRAGTSILNPCNPLVDLWNNFAAEFPQYRIEIVPFCDSVAELSEIYAHLGRRFDVMFGVYDSAAAIKPFKSRTRQNSVLRRRAGRPSPRGKKFGQFGRPFGRAHNNRPPGNESCRR